MSAAAQCAMTRSSEGLGVKPENFGRAVSLFNALAACGHSKESAACLSVWIFFGSKVWPEARVHRVLEALESCWRICTFQYCQVL